MITFQQIRNATTKHCFYVFAISILFMFASQTGSVYSRIILFSTSV